jgi:tellurite resistance protein
MTSDLEDVWNNRIQKDFLKSLSPAQTEALLDLLVVATFADDSVSLEERRGLSLAIAQLPEIDEALDLESAELADRTETLYERYESERDALLDELVERLQSDPVRRHAFRTAVQLLAADRFLATEEKLVRDLGERMGIEETVIDFALEDAREA